MIPAPPVRLLRNVPAEQRRVMADEPEEGRTCCGLPGAPQRVEAGGPVTTTRIRPTTGLSSLRLADLWAYRELLYFFVWRDVKVRYKQTALGAAWAILQPAMMMVVFTIFFGRLAKLPAGDLPMLAGRSRREAPR